jgi:hypothetical protein
MGKGDPRRELPIIPESSTPEDLLHHVISIHEHHLREKPGVGLMTAGLRIVVDASRPSIGQFPLLAYGQRQRDIFKQGITSELARGWRVRQGLSPIQGTTETHPFHRNHFRKVISVFREQIDGGT